MKNFRKEKKNINAPCRAWDTDLGGTLGAMFVSMVFSGSIIACFVSAYGLGTMPAVFWALLVLSAVGLFLTEAIVILPKGKAYKSASGKVRRSFDFSPFKLKYELVSSVSLTVPMFWGRVEIEMDCSNARKVPSIGEIQFGLCLTGSAEAPEANSEAETALLLARRNIILRKFKAVRAEDYDPNTYYDKAFEMLEPSCA